MAAAGEFDVGVDVSGAGTFDQSLLEFDPRSDSRFVSSQPEGECLFRALFSDSFWLAVSHPAHESLSASQVESFARRGYGIL